VIPLLKKADPPAYIVRALYPLHLYEQVEPDGRSLFLPGVPTVVYTTSAPVGRGPSREWRRKRIRTALNTFGFREWQFFSGASCDPYWKQIPLDWAAILREREPPLLILEDDAEPRAFRANLELPACAEIAYLGGFRGGESRGTKNAIAAGLAVRRKFSYSYSEIDSCWFRVFGMWGSHAVLWLSRAAMIEFAELLETLGRPVDSVFAQEQYRRVFACVKMPLFFQNDGHHIRDTWQYW